MCILPGSGFTTPFPPRMASPLFHKLLLCNGLSCLWHCLPNDPTAWLTHILRICLSPGECIKTVSIQIRLFVWINSRMHCSLFAFGCVLVALRLEHRQRVGFPFYLPSYIDDSWWFPFVYPLLFESGNIHISYGCFPFDYYPFWFGSCIPFVPLPLPKTTWSCPSTYIYSGTWQNIPKPCQSLPTILRGRLCASEHH